ncbi:hypothetical protein E2C01_001101 [Portunus trituberculatus]|uniref:Uncharacterized protein n=1 Tax=Portunus trituberculatus TaxID=210409 RepID=A0A5B7CII1_PORTR|nr:hypothetical protein [Portunus trituberculatus]
MTRRGALPQDDTTICCRTVDQSFVRTRNNNIFSFYNEGYSDPRICGMASTESLKMIDRLAAPRCSADSATGLLLLKGPPWYSGTMRALGSEGSPRARVRILSTVRV